MTTTWRTSFLLSIALLLITVFGSTLGTVDCKNKMMKCYHCDSRFEPYCDDPFNLTLVPEKTRNTTDCNGCCVKFMYKHDNEDWILRTCLRNIVVYHLQEGNNVCMDEAKLGDGKLCVCVQDLCNGSHSNFLSSYPSHEILTILHATFLQYFLWKLINQLSS